MKSGQVRFAVSISEMQNQTEELKRQNQSGLYKNSTIAKTGNMQGAQYRIEGSISSIVKSTKDVKDVYYVFNLNLINNRNHCAKRRAHRAVHACLRKKASLQYTNAMQHDQAVVLRRAWSSPQYLLPVLKRDYFPMRTASMSKMAWKRSVA